jgi:hypothetical protein
MSFCGMEKAGNVRAGLLDAIKNAVARTTALI